MSDDDFDGVVAAYRQALDAFLQGNPGPVAELFSQGDDVTLANPLGPPRCGRAEVEKGIGEAAANCKNGTFHVSPSRRKTMVARSDMAVVSSWSTNCTFVRSSWRT